jgi:hypothetical protein
MPSLLVLTGVTRPADLLRAAATQRPTYVASDLRALSIQDSAVRVPAWPEGETLGGWRVTLDDVHIGLSGSGEPDDAVRALAAAAWHAPQWTQIRPEGAAAEQVARALGLTSASAA